MKPRNAPAIPLLNEAHRAAAATRGEWLQTLANGLVTVQDVVVAAATEPALARMRLHRLIVAATGSDAAATRVVTRIQYLASPRRNLGPTGPRLSWFLDRRAGYQRLEVFTEALASEEDDSRSPWKGFPFTPAPPKDHR